jgi:hypothetical protein
LLVIGHDVVWIVDQAFSTVGKANRKQIGIGPLGALPCGMNDEILDLEEAILRRKYQ